MTDSLPLCPECSSEHAYEMGALLVCPMCGHEWSPSEAAETAGSDEPGDSVVKDAVGNVLSDGDTVTLVTSVKVKGSTGIKAGTKVRGIRLIDPVNGHDIDCKIDGFGAMLLKSSVVKKA
ncbi:MAG TPA: phosphonoacetate hydrolase [Microbacterium sp.]|uniref:zinc ribbon domain-containing protein YjdM n=1 Tax=Microbacterium sp. TaxID=51671 RepID=UPI000EEAA7C7|nr:phosphonoacetate hydrolase [Microbacterium sp.]